MVSVNTSDKDSNDSVLDNQAMVQNGSSETQGVSEGGLDAIPNQASSAVRGLKMKLKEYERRNHKTTDKGLQKTGNGNNLAVVSDNTNSSMVQVGTSQLGRLQTVGGG